MTDLEIFEKLVSLGGNGAAMAAVWIGWQIYKGMREEIAANTRAVHAVKRAVATLGDEAASIIDEHESKEEAIISARAGKHA